MSEPVKYELPGELTVGAEGAVRIVTINRPDELNAVNQPLHWALGERLAAARRRPRRQGRHAHRRGPGLQRGR